MTPQEWLNRQADSPRYDWGYQCGCGVFSLIKNLTFLRCPSCGQDFEKDSEFMSFNHG